MRVEITDDTVELRLSRAQHVLGLMKDVRVRRADVHDVEVVQEPVREAMRGGMKAGLRIPWVYYVARSIRLDKLFVVRRGVPALAFDVANHPFLKRVVVSTPEAAELAARLRSPSS